MVTALITSLIAFLVVAGWGSVPTPRDTLPSQSEVASEP